VKLDYELRDEFRKGNLVLFVGAGFVRSYLRSMPLWGDLLKRVFSSITEDPDEIFKYSTPAWDEKGKRVVLSSEYLRLAQEFELVRRHKNRRRGTSDEKEIHSIHHQVHQQISEAYDSHNIAKSVADKSFGEAADLPLNTWVTTNYDQFLEDTVLHADLKRGTAAVLRRPVRNRDFAGRSAQGKTLYKIHGCISADPESSIVITEDDYHRFLRQDRYIVNKLYTLFCERIVVFLGYSLTDPNIQFIYNEVLFDQKLHDTEEELSFSRVRPAYFVSRDAIPEEQKSYYRYKKIRYIEECEIESFFAELVETHKVFQNGIAGVRERIQARQEEYSKLIELFDWGTKPESIHVSSKEKRDWVAKVLDLIEYFNSAYIAGPAKADPNPLFDHNRFAVAVHGMIDKIDELVKDEVNGDNPDLLDEMVSFAKNRLGVSDSWVFKEFAKRIGHRLRRATGLKEVKDLTSRYIDLMLEYDREYNDWDDYVFCLEQYIRASKLFRFMHVRPRQQYVEHLYQQLRMCGRGQGESWYSTEKVYEVWSRFDAEAWPALEKHIQEQSEDPSQIYGKDKAMLEHLRPGGDPRGFLPRI
jgi:hypothetical protein